ncbi:MAG: DHH family phosphoesterase [Nitrososphaerota archaeon]|nr:DHH family phosphoesterase [Nitrososphaerota archaeon]
MDHISRRSFNGKVLLLVHKNADMDSMGAAIALAELTKYVGGVAEILAPISVSKLTSEFFGNSIRDWIKLAEQLNGHYHLAVVLDAGSSYMLDRPDLLKRASKRAIIDHHPPNIEFLNDFDIRLVDETASSTCEIVGELYRRLRIKPTISAARSMMAGMLFDSQNLRLASCRTIAIVSWLCRYVSITDVRRMLRNELDRSERIARLKSAKRVELYALGDYVVAISEVGSFQASAARGLISMGADVAFVGGKGGEGLRVSGRSSESFYEKTHLHLGKDVIKPMATTLDGHGGGHPTAATLNARIGWREVKPLIINTLAEGVGMTFRVLV